MATFISFNEGRKEVANNGLPATCFFLLSTRGVGAGTAHAVGDTLAGGVGEITGTGYVRASEAEPAATLANPSAVVFAVKSFATGAATDWPASVRSIVMATTVDNTGKAICAWDLQATSAARDMSGANTTENYTPTLSVA